MLLIRNKSSSGLFISAKRSGPFSSLDGLKEKLFCKPQSVGDVSMKTINGKKRQLPYSSFLLFCLQKKRKIPLKLSDLNSSPVKKKYSALNVALHYF